MRVRDVAAGIAAATPICCSRRFGQKIASASRAHGGNHDAAPFGACSCWGSENSPWHSFGQRCLRIIWMRSGARRLCCAHRPLPTIRAWAELRALSRSHLTPWEPAWARDDLSRQMYRRRLRAYAKDVRDDFGYSFFICDARKRRACRRHHAFECAARIGANGVAWLLDRQALCWPRPDEGSRQNASAVCISHSAPASHRSGVHAGERRLDPRARTRLGFRREGLGAVVSEDQWTVGRPHAFRAL